MIGARPLAAVAGCAVLLLSGCGGDEGAGVPVTSPSTTATFDSAPAEPDPDVVAFLQPCPVSGTPVGRGDGLPELELPCLGPGAAVQLSGLTGRPRLINVWASWCGPCREELPWLQEAADTGKLDVLGVNAEDQASAAGALLEELAVSFPSVFDPSNELARALGIPTKPTTIMVTPEGEIVWVKSGAFTSYEDLAEQVDTYLGIALP